MTNHTSPIPVLETDHLILRGQKPSDFEAYAKHWASERSADHGYGGPYNRSDAWDNFAADAGHWLLKGYGCWMVEEKATGSPIGWIGFYHPDRYEEAELGWNLFEEFEGRGFAYEAAMAAREFGRHNFGLTAPASFIDARNIRSIRLAERMGATLQESRDHGDGPFHIYRHPPEQIPTTDIGGQDD